MKAYFAFTQKEMLESFRTYKFLIMILAFVFFGILGPLTAKLLPKILEGFMPEGVQIIITEPTALDSWAQFFKNVSQMGFAVIAILFSGMMANEFNSGTFINILTKGLARSTVIFSKFTVASMIWTISYFICFCLSYIYTRYLWDNDEVLNLPFSLFYLWLFGIMFLSVIMLGGVIFKSSYGCLIFLLGFIITLFLLSIMPTLYGYNPIELVSKSMSLLTGDTIPKDLVGSTTISSIIIILSITLAIGVFNRKQI